MRIVLPCKVDGAKLKRKDIHSSFSTRNDSYPSADASSAAASLINGQRSSRSFPILSLRTMKPVAMICMLLFLLDFSEAFLVPTRFLSTATPRRLYPVSLSTCSQKDKDTRIADATITSAYPSNCTEVNEKDGVFQNLHYHLDSLLPSSMSTSSASRRLFFSASLLAASTALSTAHPTSCNAAVELQKWESTPINKRTGVTVYDVEQDGYNKNFVTYLSRFLLSFDKACQTWWLAKAADLPRTATAEEVNAVRLAQFGAFSASIEVSLREYRAAQGGPQRLLRALVQRYCPEEWDQTGLSEKAIAAKERKIKEARRQITLLFALMEKNQPTEELTKLLAGIDNGSISKVRILDQGSGYAPGYGPPAVVFPPPDAGPGYETATGRAVLAPNGRILRVDVVNRGGGYSKPPSVSISPPAVIRFAPPLNPEDADLAAVPELATTTAQAKAILFRSGPNKGRIERIELTDPGAGYIESEIIRIRVGPPDVPVQKGGAMATATAVLEYQVESIQILNNGTGYAVEKPIKVQVEPPPLTARVNMNDPMVARVIPSDEPLPPTSIPSRDMLARMPDSKDPKSVEYRALSEAKRGGGAGCIGRACYDRPVQAIAYPRAEADVFSGFLNDDDVKSIEGIESAALDSRDLPRPARVVSGSNSGGDAPFVFEDGSPSSELLSLLPSGIGLVFNSEKGRYELAQDPNFRDDVPHILKESRRIDPDFGPRGRSPIERDKQLGLDSYLRFVASGAICCAGVHLSLTPIDVVKTKVQTDPENYPGVIRGFKKVLADGGPTGFFTGWAPTFVGFFFWGGVSYGFTEFFRRTLIAFAGEQVSGLEVPIILTASAMAATLGSFVITPFEAVRIRSVFQKDYAPNIVAVFNRIVAEEGFMSLFSAVPPTLAKEIPFACAKFTVFDLSTAFLYDAFPAAKEDIQLSLAVSLTGGLLGGIFAAIVSNPADVTISVMKRAKTGMTPGEAVQDLLDGGGISALFAGLPLRIAFYMLLVSLQFLIYDAIRIALGVGSDDLKLYLDVLGGALSESGGPA